MWRACGILLCRHTARRVHCPPGRTCNTGCPANIKCLPGVSVCIRSRYFCVDYFVCFFGACLIAFLGTFVCHLCWLACPTCTPLRQYVFNSAVAALPRVCLLDSSTVLVIIRFSANYGGTSRRRRRRRSNAPADSRVYAIRSWAANGVYAGRTFIFAYVVHWTVLD